MEYVEFLLAGRTFRFETGKVAKQASGSALVRYGDTVVFAANVHGEEKPDAGFLSLTVDYREKMYAAGKYPGGYFKREGRPTTQEILVMRLIDRPIRPLFPKGYLNEEVITSIVLSYDQENEPDVLAVNAASCALLLSGVPFAGPLGCVRVGRIGNHFVLNPTRTQLKSSSLDLIVCGTQDKVVMIEGESNELPPQAFIEAVRFAMEPLKTLVNAQQRLAEKVKIHPVEYALTEKDETLINELEKEYKEKIRENHFLKGKFARRNGLNSLFEKILEERKVEDEETKNSLKKAFDEIERRVMREAILKEGRRADGRSPKELRPLDVEVGILPRTHGSAMFIKGETQALVTVTLGTLTDAQLIDGLPPEYFKKFMLHYNFHGFSVGETWVATGPKRREIGHGALAERALSFVLPDEENFPYTIRIVSDILESDGSTSMATVCGGTLSLMDAGVPLKRPVGGVSIGLVMENDKWTTLSDICGLEDHLGDMDFKIASTEMGITAVQLDIKLPGISLDVIETAMNQAVENNKEIVTKILSLSGLSSPRQSVSIYAPKIAQISVDPEKIGMVIGSQGRTIKKIQSDSGATVEIEENGKVLISGPTEEAIERAKSAIQAIVADVEIGNLYAAAKVTEIKSFGVLLEIAPGREGMCHISELSDGYIRNIEDFVKVGDYIPVKVIGFDDMERPRLSRRLALKELGKPEEWKVEVRQERQQENKKVPNNRRPLERPRKPYPETEDKN
ncbi:MAG: polyribonucleotide nucleotidyltransferase [Planctomycetota bacterium]|nr:polyribonucleotide nucleotidyltransferase [Planctomycetota bacterium]